MHLKQTLHSPAFCTRLSSCDAPPQVVAKDYPRPNFQATEQYKEAQQLSAILRSAPKPDRPLKIVIAGAGTYTYATSFKPYLLCRHYHCSFTGLHVWSITLSLKQLHFCLWEARGVCISMWRILQVLVSNLSIYGSVTYPILYIYVLVHYLQAWQAFLLHCTFQQQDITQFCWNRTATLAARQAPFWPP